MLLPKYALLLAIALSTTACGIIQAETSRPGGAVGAAADRTVFPAWSKPMQAYRGLVVGTALARMAERNAVTSATALTAVTAMNGVAATTGRLYELAIADCYTEGQADRSWSGAEVKAGTTVDPYQCHRNAYSVLFEAKLPDLHESLYSLASAALPPERFGEVAASLGSGNYLGVLWSLLLAARDAAVTLHYGLSVGRSATEQRAIVMKDNAVPNPFDVRVAALIVNAEQASLQAGNGTPDHTAFYAMFALMKESCFRVQRRIATTAGRTGVKCLETFGAQTTPYNDGLNPGSQD